MSDDPSLVDRLRDNRRGIYWMLVTTGLFTSLDATAKYLAQDYPVPQVLWARFTFHLVFVALVLGVRLSVTLHSQRLSLQLLRSLLMLVTTAMFFFAVRALPLADVVAIMFVGPLFVTALSVPLLGDYVGPRRWTAVAIGFLGALVVVRPGSGIMQGLAVLPLLAAFSHALYTITTRKLASHDLPMTTLFYTAALGGVATTAIVPFFWVTPDVRGWLLMALLGVFGAAGHLTLIKALGYASPVVVAPLTYASLIWSIGYGFVLFGDLPDAMTLLGAALIAASGLYVFHRERIRAADAAPARDQ
ncbi:MAG: EamA family transporter [Gammaproteobacteria bacterium]|nr:EamA family transporter [Gammaproteobacteria bacterium]NIM73270.1 EamA family transporter [Gammaproteobacteria bacterium]NIO24971.1 EamA family transporter [Gammaproteobacteria bacterium]NIO65573.1 EamA family transporter [Gammaproteobacteria bacterium]NIP46879.1 DMT family transporter [Gammaproteobacteria bacterium]